MMPDGVGGRHCGTVKSLTNSSLVEGELGQGLTQDLRRATMAKSKLCMQSGGMSVWYDIVILLEQSIGPKESCDVSVMSSDAVKQLRLYAVSITDCLVV